MLPVVMAPPAKATGGKRARANEPIEGGKRVACLSLRLCVKVRAARVDIRVRSGASWVYPAVCSWSRIGAGRPNRHVAKR